MNKRANFPDVISWIEVVFILVFVGGMTLLIVDKWNDNVQTMDVEIVPAEVKVISADYNSALPTLLDYLFVGMFVVFVGFSVFAARLIPSTPKYIFVTIIALIFIPLGAMFAKNILSGWMQQPMIESVFVNTMFIPYFVTYLQYVSLFYVVVIGIALLSKEQG